MAELAGLPTLRMDWSSTDAPQALKKKKEPMRAILLRSAKGQKRGRARELPSDLVQ